MKCRSEARVAGSSQLIEVTLEDHDMLEKYPDWDTKPVPLRWQLMSRMADTLIVEYMARNGHISMDYAQQRIQSINGAPQ